MCPKVSADNYKAIIFCILNESFLMYQSTGLRNMLGVVFEHCAKSCILHDGALSVHQFDRLTACEVESQGGPHRIVPTE